MRNRAIITVSMLFQIAALANKMKANDIAAKLGISEATVYVYKNLIVDRKIIKANYNREVYEEYCKLIGELPVPEEEDTVENDKPENTEDNKCDNNTTDDAGNNINQVLLTIAKSICDQNKILILISKRIEMLTDAWKSSDKTQDKEDDEFTKRLEETFAKNMNGAWQ